MKVVRFKENPIIQSGMDNRMGKNINGPSLIRVPDWVPSPLGKYYLYFAHHRGYYIRMAYADRLEGPWKIYGPGVLSLNDALFDRQVAAPDVHVLDDRKEIRMYFRGCCVPGSTPNRQMTRLAVSAHGLMFKASPVNLGGPYWRAFQWNGYWYALEMPGRFVRSRSGISGFERGPSLFMENMRHSALLLDGEVLTVFYSNRFACPERILYSKIQLNDDWYTWTASEPKALLEPEMDWEGVDCSLASSIGGAVYTRVRELRDPCIFREDGRTYLLYAAAGEQGIAIGELI